MAKNSSERETEREAAKGPTFEQGLEQLQAIVHQLEEGEIGLDESLKQYEKGIKLLRRCYDLLQRAERRIELLSGVDPEGNPISSPIDDPALAAEGGAAGLKRPPGRKGRSAHQGGREMGLPDGGIVE